MTNSCVSEQALIAVRGLCFSSNGMSHDILTTSNLNTTLGILLFPSAFPCMFATCGEPTWSLLSMRLR